MSNIKRKRDTLFFRFPSFNILLNVKNNGIKKTITEIRGYRAIKENNLFDKDYYLKNNDEIRVSGIDPLLHYIYFGFKEGKNPSPTFDGNYYLQTYIDAQNANLNPLIHYSIYGINERRSTYLPNSDTHNLELFKQEDYNELKLTLKGKEGYLFLVNDSNNEIRQHFDPLYKSMFNAEIFTRTFNLKKNFCNQKNIEHYLFIIPDKSLICKDFLPFDFNIIKRNYDLISDSIPDFAHNLDSTCYFKNDSHINYLGGKELTYNYLNYIDNDFKRADFNRLNDEQISIVDFEYSGDLTSEINWSYSDEEKKDYLNEKITIFTNKNLIDLNKEIPEEFGTINERKTEYIKNPHSYTSLRVLIFMDSSLIFLKDSLSTYFKEMILYWDHWNFNKELIKWYKPDVILEIKTERFLENSISFLNRMSVYAKSFI